MNKSLERKKKESKKARWVKTLVAQQETNNHSVTHQNMRLCPEFYIEAAIFSSFLFDYLVHHLSLFAFIISLVYVL